MPALAQATLQISSTSAVAGSPANLNIEFNSVASNVVALQWTIIYSPADINSIQITNGPGALAAGKSISCAGSNGVLTCVAVGMNANALANGALGLGTLQLSNTPAAYIPIQLSGVVGSDPNGEPVEVAASGGAINITSSNSEDSSSMLLFVDQPSSQFGPIQGAAIFSGWAITRIAPLSRIAVAIDGVPNGVANYGASRPDVCEAFPGRPGCPNVGWSYMLDTTRLANGLHTLALTGFTTTGAHRTSTASFSVANWSTGGLNPIQITIDNPAEQGTALAGTATVWGWAIDRLAAVSSVSLSIDGVAFGNVNYGGSRPDVCAVFPAVPGCPGVGWSFLLDTGLLADGDHTLTLTANSVSGARTATTRTFVVNNAGGANGMRTWIDTPGAQNGTFSGMTTFAGWALDGHTAISSVTTLVDGIYTQPARYGANRPDVCRVYSSSSCPNVGWNVFFDTTQLSNGTHYLQVTATGSDGQHATAATSFVAINADPGNGAVVFVDQPNKQSSPLTGVSAFSGWAINPHSPVTQVRVAIDRTLYGNATYGLDRPDVCAIFAAADCPNVGWAVLVDTTQFANGSHTLTVDAISSSGQHVGSTVTFEIANWEPAGNPTRIVIDTRNVQSGPQSGSIPVGGWAINDNGSIANVAIGIDGAPNGNAVYGGNRPDVCQVFSGRSGCPNVGWSYSLDTTLIADGAHQLQVIATSSSGQSTVVSVPIQIANLTGANPIRITIDQPSPEGNATNGVAAISGWAVDDQAAISEVIVSVDGVARGHASYGGSRPDVCSAFPGRPGCPNVGWNLLLDTTLLGNGAHQLAITAVSSTGERATLGRMFSVMN